MNTGPGSPKFSGSSKTKIPPEWAEEIQAAARFIAEHDGFLVVSHLSPDGDAIGSTLAMAGILKALNKSYRLANPDRIPAKYGILPWADELVTPEDEAACGPFDVVVALDAGDVRRLEPFPDRFAAGVHILNVDHHPTNTGYGTVQLVVPDAAATAQLVYYLACALDVAIDKPLATCLYTGIMTDTGGFRYSNTNPEVMRIAADLLRAGADPARLAEQFLERMSVGQLALLQRTLARMQRELDGRLSWTYVTLHDFEEVGATEADIDGLVQYLLRVEGVQVGILFRQTAPDRCKVSFRSREPVDVSRLAAQFGGGGHARAAGCVVSGDLPQVMEQVRRRACEAMTGSL